MEGKTLVAVLGTGKMGAAIARRLDEVGVEVHLWNRTRERAVAVGVGSVHDSVTEAIAGADVVLTSLTGPEAIDDVLLGSAGALGAATAQVFVDLSTIGPHASERVAQAAGERGLGFVEAPVLGSVQAAEAGRLVVLAGGPAAVIEQLGQVLESLGEVRHIGDVAAASRLKLIANSELALVNVVAAELLAAGTEVGLDAELVWPVLTRLVPYLDSRRAGFLEHVYEPVTFAVRDMVKDLRLSLGAYEESGCEVPMTSLGAQLYERAAAKYADDDMSAIAAVWQEDRRPS